MKALSLRQPWAHFVLHYGKTIENRKWVTPFRGTFLIHASKGMTRGEYDDAMNMLDDVNGLQTDPIAFDALQRGGFVGVAMLYGVVSPRLEFVLGGVEALYPPGVEWRWHMREQHGFLLKDIRQTPFVPFKGMLGFFDVPDDVVSQVLGTEAP